MGWAGWWPTSAPMRPGGSTVGSSCCRCSTAGAGPASRPWRVSTAVCSIGWPGIRMRSPGAGCRSPPGRRAGWRSPASPVWADDGCFRPEPGSDPMSRSRLVVVGGGLAGMRAALVAADAGCEVTLIERRRKLGGLTWSFERHGRWFDNGQHVFMRCCNEYRSLLERLGMSGSVTLQPRLDVPVLSPGGTRASIRRSGLPAPLHLAGAIARYRHLSVADRCLLARAVFALQKLDPEDPE